MLSILAGTLMLSLVDKIRGVIDKNDPRFAEMKEAFKSGALHEPSRPMSDSELTAAIEEYLAKPHSDAAIVQLQRRFEKIGDPLQKH